MNILDALLLELLGSLDTLPGRANLDEDALLVDTLLLVQVNDLVRLVDRGLCLLAVSLSHISSETLM